MMALIIRATRTHSRPRFDLIRVPFSLVDLIDILEIDRATFPNATVTKTDKRNVVIVLKPSEGLYGGALIRFDCEVPVLYPYQPPRLKCPLRIFHPNIDIHGNVCINILRLDWRPVMSLAHVLHALVLLFDPDELVVSEEDPPLSHDAGELFVRDRREFERITRLTLGGGEYLDVKYDNVIDPKA